MCIFIEIYIHTRWNNACIVLGCVALCMMSLFRRRVSPFTTAWSNVLAKGVGACGIKPSCLQAAAYQVTSTLPSDACSPGCPRLKLEAGSAQAWDSILICLSGTQRGHSDIRCRIWEVGKWLERIVSDRFPSPFATYFLSEDIDGFTAKRATSYIDP